MDKFEIVLNEKGEISSEAAKKIKDLLSLKKDIDELEKQVKALFLQEMKDRKLDKISVDGVTITFVEGTSKETFDKKKFRAENEDLYNDYITFEKSADYVKIAVKEKKEQ